MRWTVDEFVTRITIAAILTFVIRKNAIACREDDVITGAALYFLINELQ
jgi:hypothetical protein